MHVYCLFIICIYKYKHIEYIFRKYLRVCVCVCVCDCIYIQYIPFYIIYNYLIYKLKYIHACVCIYIHIINIHSARSYIIETKTFILDVIHRFTALI